MLVMYSLVMIYLLEAFKRSQKKKETGGTESGLESTGDACLKTLVRQAGVIFIPSPEIHLVNMDVSNIRIIK